MDYSDKTQVSQQGGSRMEIAKVSQVDYEKGKVKLTIDSKDGAVTNWTPYSSAEYEMPKVGDTVLYVPENTNYSNPYAFGLCLGRYYNKNEVPKLSGKDVYYKPMLGDVVFIYNSTEKKLTIQTEKRIDLKSVDKISIQAKEIAVEGQEIQLTAEALQLNAAKITLNGETVINGEMAINGNLTVSGTVTAANI